MKDRIREAYQHDLGQILELDHLIIAEHRVLFEKAYQIRELISITGGEERNKEAAWAIRGQQQLPVPVAKTRQDLFQSLQHQHRVIVEADAWTGKSTLCRWVIRECLDNKSKHLRSTRHRPWVPIFIRFQDLSQSGLHIEEYL